MTVQTKDSSTAKGQAKSKRIRSGSFNSKNEYPSQSRRAKGWCSLMWGICQMNWNPFSKKREMILQTELRVELK